MLALTVARAGRAQSVCSDASTVRANAQALVGDRFVVPDEVAIDVRPLAPGRAEIVVRIGDESRSLTGDCDELMRAAAVVVAAHYERIAAEAATEPESDDAQRATGLADVEAEDERPPAVILEPNPRSREEPSPVPIWGVRLRFAGSFDAGTGELDAPVATSWLLAGGALRFDPWRFDAQVAVRFPSDVLVPERAGGITSSAYGVVVRGCWSPALDIELCAGADLMAAVASGFGLDVDETNAGLLAALRFEAGWFYRFGAAIDPLVGAGVGAWIPISGTELVVRGAGASQIGPAIQLVAQGGLDFL